jgi:hypothetical protein
MASASDKRRLDQLITALQIARATRTCDGGGVRVVMLENGVAFDDATADGEPCAAHGPVKTLIIDDPTLRPTGALTGRKPLRSVTD